GRYAQNRGEVLRPRSSARIHRFARCRPERDPMNVTKNLGLRVGALGAALLATAGLHGIIQARPAGQTSAAVTATPAQAPSSTAVVTPPPVWPGSSTDNMSAPSVPSDQPPSGGSTQSSPPPRYQRPIARTRAS